ncbi:MAG TPA: ABC transporter substrate-binding protein [Acidimicrobiia bacterium]|nr:ABC transporter substrate-binding protein [Acidimicrobiia bacterium]
MRSRGLRALVLVSVLALVVAACSDGTTDTTTAGETTTTAASGGETTTAGGGGGEGDFVTIGVLAPLTGEIGEFGQIVSEAFEMGINEINASGLNTCGEIRLQFADTETNPEVAIRGADQMIGSTENLVGFFGPSSGEMVALVDTAHEEELMLVSPYAGTTELNELGGDFVYRTVASDLADGEAAAAFIIDQGWETAAIIAQVAESPLSSANVVRQLLADAGVNVLADVEIVAGQASYEAEFSGVIADSPEVIYMSVGIESGVTILREANSLGYDGNWMLSADLVGQDTIDLTGPDIVEEKVYAEGAESDPDLPEYQRFADLYMDEFDVEPKVFSPNAYDAAMLFGLAMMAADECTGAGINAAFRDVAGPPGTVVGSFEEGAQALMNGEEIDYNGASGVLEFDDAGTPPGSFAIFQVLNGTFERVAFYPASFFVE